VWADTFHPTTRVHALIGDAAFRYVTTGQNVAVIPEPATVALVAGGLVLVAGVARRKRAA
jgi:phospholipase/lecithinase/hemolysin